MSSTSQKLTTLVRANPNSADGETSASISAVYISFSKKNVPNLQEFIDEHPPARILYKNNIPKTVIYILELALVFTHSPFHILFQAFESGLQRCKNDWVKNHVKEVEKRFSFHSKNTTPYNQTQVLNHLHYWLDTFHIHSLYHNRNYVISLLLLDIKNYSNLLVIEKPISRKIDQFIPFITLFWVYRKNENKFREQLTSCENHSMATPNSDCAIYRAFIITCLTRENDNFLNEILSDNPM
jgi:hypothetical protein